MPVLSIGKLAKSCDVKVDTVRYYERKSLLLPLERTESGYRVYSKDSVKRLRFIRKAQSLGFTLEEIKELLELGNSPDADCANVREKAHNKITEVEERISNLLSIKQALANLADFCPGKGKPLNECSIIQHLYGEES